MGLRLCAEFTLPVQYNVTAADRVNELLFELLTRQLAQLGHREVLLQESDCRLLLHNLDLQAAASRHHKDNDEDTIGTLKILCLLLWAHSNIKLVELEAEVDAFGTPREANNTPRSPREVNSSINLSSRCDNLRLFPYIRSRILNPKSQIPIPIFHIWNPGSRIPDPIYPYVDPYMDTYHTYIYGSPIPYSTFHIPYVES